MVEPSFDSTLAHFSNDNTMFRLVWNSGIKKVKSILSACKINVKFFIYIHHCLGIIEISPVHWNSTAQFPAETHQTANQKTNAKSERKALTACSLIFDVGQRCYNLSSCTDWPKLKVHSVLRWAQICTCMVQSEQDLVVVLMTNHLSDLKKDIIDR